MSDTIAAIATPFGPGAIALIRVTGEEALGVSSGALGKDCDRLEPRTVHRAEIRAGGGDVIDDVLLTIFRNPRSYTGEDLSLIHI